MFWLTFITTSIMFWIGYSFVILLILHKDYSMNLKDFDKVESLVNQRDHILRSIKNCELFLNGNNNKNWWGHLSVHRDGSGEIVDLCYCEVLDDVVDATNAVLKVKLDVVNSELLNLGVKV